MPCVEYHLLLILICLIKNGISLDLRKNWVGTRTHSTLASEEKPRCCILSGKLKVLGSTSYNVGSLYNMSWE